MAVKKKIYLDKELFIQSSLRRKSARSCFAWSCDQDFALLDLATKKTISATPDPPTASVPQTALVPQITQAPVPTELVLVLAIQMTEMMELMGMFYFSFVFIYCSLNVVFFKSMSFLVHHVIYEFINLLDKIVLGVAFNFLTLNLVIFVLLTLQNSNWTGLGVR